MTAPAPRLQSTNIRTRVVSGQPLIGVKHTAKTSSGLPVSTAWIDMSREDVEGLIKSLQDALDDLSE